MVRATVWFVIAGLGTAWHCGSTAAELPPVVDSVLDPRLAGTEMATGGVPRVGLEASVLFGLRLSEVGSGVRIADGTVRVADALAVEQDDGSLFVEAENAEQLCPDEGGGDSGIAQHPDCAGGRFVSNPAFLRVPFRLSTAGERDVWLRAEAGAKQERLCFWGIDGSRALCTAPSVAVAEEGQPAVDERTWRWVRAGSAELAAGPHRFALQRFYRADCRIDRIALLPVGSAVPEGIGPAERTAQLLTGWIETGDVTPPAVQALEELTADAALHGGSMAISVSTDSGESWRDAPDGNLAGCELRQDGTDTVRFRVALTRSTSGLSPVLHGVRLRAKPARAAWLGIRNDFVRILLDGRTGRLFRLTDVARDREVLWPDASVPLFAVDLKQRGTAKWVRYSDDRTQWVQLGKDRRGRDIDELIAAEGLEPTQSDEMAGASLQPAQFTGAVADAASLTLSFTVEQRVRLRFSFRLDTTGQSVWTAAVVNGHPALDVIRLRFPCLPTVRLGTNGLDDVQFRMQQFGHRRLRPGLGPLREATYPGMALPFESVHDDEGGLGTVVRDRLGTHVRFSARSDSAWGDTFSTHLEKRHCIPANGGQIVWETAVALHPGKWHWVADRYREWALQHFARPLYPEWFAGSDGYFFYPIMNTGMKFRDLGTLAPRAQRLGLKHVQIWGQFTDYRHGCCGPYWMPSPRFGTIEEFKQGIADIHDADCKVGFYFLHDRIDLYHAEGSHVYGFIEKNEFASGTEFPTAALFERVQLITDPAGKARAYPLSEQDWAEYAQKLKDYEADPAKHKPPCKWQPVDLSDPVWWDYMRHWAIDKYVEGWGADGHYYDVLGCGSARESFDLRKGHHGHGLFGVGKAGLARATVECALERGHDQYFLLQEGLCDLPGQYTAGLNTSLYYNQTAAVRYTWPDYAIFDDHAGQGARALMRVVEMGFLNGNRLGIRLVNHTMADIVSTRARIRDWLQHGRFLDTLGVDSPVPARLFVRRDRDARGAVVTFLNREKRAGSVTVDRARVGDVSRAVGVDTTGATFPVALEREGDGIRFALPAAHLAAVVLIEHAARGQSLVGGIRMVRENAGAGIEVDIANLADRRVDGAAVIDGLEPLGLGPQTMTFDCVPGGMGVLRVPVKADTFRGRFVRPVVSLFVDGKRVAQFARSFFPLFEDPSFEDTGTGDPNAIDGVRTLCIGPADGYSYRRFPLYLDAGRRYRLSLAYKRTSGKDAGCFAALFERTPDEKSARQATLPFKKDGQWDQVSAEFAVSPAALDASLYVYNRDSTRTVWLDDVRVEELDE